MPDLLLLMSSISKTNYSLSRYVCKCILKPFFLRFADISKQHFRFILAAILCCYYYRWYLFVVADNKSNIFRAIKLFIAKLMLSAVNVTHDYSLMTLYYYSITLLVLFSVFMLWFYTCKSVKKCRSCSSCWLTKLSDHSCAVTGNDPASCLRWCLFPICLAAHGNNAGRL